MTIKNTLKVAKLRHSEYYGMEEKQDELHKRSQEGNNFRNLMKFITSRDNILMAYRNIKRNQGSVTKGIDGLTIENLEQLGLETFIEIVQKRFKRYNPRKVRRVEIPKANGDKRPLGIPSIWDRVAQQCILQILEPICEAKFYKHSYGFRPQRSTENAIADVAMRMNRSHLSWVVDVDIKGFFDEVNHTKLMRQLWTLGIRDKQLLVIIRKMLKAPIVMPNGETAYPTKGTPQGGILSPLLANINLNEFDWWIANQWATRHCAEIGTRYMSNGTENMSHHTEKLRKSTNLKEMYLVRYADDFKIFCRNKESAEKIYHATKQWLYDRLQLPISEEKSKITNLKKEATEFLGFSLKLERKSNKWVCFSHVSEKSLKRIKVDLKNQMVKINKVPNTTITHNEIRKYNSKVIGIHNYYRIATHVSFDFIKMGLALHKTLYNRNKTNGLSRYGKVGQKSMDKSYKPYLKSKQIRFIHGSIILPISFVQTRNAQSKMARINQYTVEGRKLIHQKQKQIPDRLLKWLREYPIRDEQRGTVEINDNRISKYIAQNGRCAVTGKEMLPWEMHCHHIKPWKWSKDDRYSNLTLVFEEIHILIHITDEQKAKKYIENINLNEEQLKKLNSYREKVGNQILVQ